MLRSTTLFFLAFIFLVFSTACGEDEPEARGLNFEQNPENQEEECVASTDAEFCASNSFECGTHEFVDECEETRTINCGTSEDVCGDNEVCGGAGDEGVCACPPPTDAEVCAQAEYQCGPLTVTDSCGVEREIEDCEAARGVQCSEFEICEDGDCGCEPNSDADICEEAGYVCGPLTANDSCGEERIIDDCAVAIGESCPEFQTCGGGGEDGICGCTPETEEELCIAAEYQCGALTITDGCGVEREIADCSEVRDIQCSEFETCENGTCGCEPNSNAEICEDAGYECGPLTANDSCGEERIIEDCGITLGQTCPQFQTCGGGGDDGICGCIPETEEELCIEAGFECGPLSIQDSCGEVREVTDCTDAGGIECTGFFTCSGGEDEGICGCTPTSCEQEGILCGTIEDGCGNDLVCDTFCAEQIDVGDQHACAVGSGTVKCWGRNNNGQLGVGDKSTRVNPADVINEDDPTGILQDVVAVSTATHHSCALFEDTSVRCWGLNSSGQLGIGSTNNSTVPASLAITSGALKIDSGELHSCALVDDGVECWGLNDYGQIGDPTISYGIIVGVPNPVPLPAGYSAVDISMGENHSCALLQDNTSFDRSVWCWGRNRFGQIEHLQPNYQPHDTAFARDLSESLDRQTRINEPVELNYDFLLEPGVIGDPRAITTGADHTCILDNNSQNLYCWGAIMTPPTVEEPCPSALQMYAIIGENEEGEDIFGTEEQSRAAQRCSVQPDINTAGEIFPIIEYTERNDTTHNLNFVYVDYVASEPFVFHIGDSPQIDEIDVENLTVLDITSGSNHFCAIVDLPSFNKSNIFCLGTSTDGQLGDGTTNNWALPREVNRDVGDNFVDATQLALGLNFSCALMTDNNVKCWGSNAFGQIGNSDLQTDNSLRPFDVRLQVAD